MDDQAPTAVLYAAAEDVLAEALAARFGRDSSEAATTLCAGSGATTVLAVDAQGDPVGRVPTFLELAGALIESGAVLAAPWLTSDVLARRVCTIAFGWDEGQPGFADALQTVRKLMTALTLVLGRGL
jgi:hypothetical protein